MAHVEFSRIKNKTTGRVVYRVNVFAYELDNWTTVCDGREDYIIKSLVAWLFSKYGSNHTFKVNGFIFVHEGDDVPLTTAKVRCAIEQTNVDTEQ